MRTTNRLATLAAVSVLAAGALVPLEPLVTSHEARADGLIIKQPTKHPDYRLELEPHGTIVFLGRDYNDGRYRRPGRGGGFYAFDEFEGGGGIQFSIEILDNVIPKLNNNLAITFGTDITNCGYCSRAFYSDGRRVDEVSLWHNVGARWSFFIHERFSAFADLGFMLRTFGWYYEVYPDPMFHLGGRVHFNDKVSLTFKFGYPFITLGPSIFL